MENWAKAEGLSLICDPKLPPSFNRSRWKKSYNPDLIFVSDKITSQTVKNVCDPILNTHHRTLILSVGRNEITNKIPA